MPVSIKSNPIGGEAIISIDGVETVRITEGKVEVYVSGAWTELGGASSLGELSDVSTTGATTGDVLTYDGTEWSAEAPSAVGTEDIADGAVTGAKLANGYTYVERIIYTSNGSFAKANYSWLRAIRMIAVGGGGAGGGAASTGASGLSAGAGGAGGGYSESWTTAIGGLVASLTITVGTGGVGVTGAKGDDGGFSSVVNGVSALVRANGGTGGSTTATTSVITYWIDDTLPGDIGTGNRRVAGGIGTGAALFGTTTTAANKRARGGSGGSSGMGYGFGGRGRNSAGTGVAGTGAPSGAGGGGGGGANAVNRAANAGGAGRLGIVTLELYA